MKLTETHFVSGRPVGLIVQDSKSGQVDFLPREKSTRPTGGPWRDVDELKRALALLHSSGPGVER